MGKADREQVEKSLRQFRRRKFERVKAQGSDALVTFVRNEGDTDPALLEKLRRASESRWYPTEKGLLVRLPYGGGSFDPQHFRVEPGGWDHEHCEACRGIIRVKETCYITTRGSFILLCKKCYRRLARLVKS